jgi:hypothetical protein
VKLDKEYTTENPVKVVNISSLLFSKSKKNLKNFKGSFSETVIEERWAE